MEMAGQLICWGMIIFMTLPVIGIIATNRIRNKKLKKDKDEKK
jgi:hypothetical protein